MKIRPPAFVALAAVLLAAGPGRVAGQGASAAPGEPVATPTPDLVARIEKLLGARLRPEPLPVTPPNPFEVTTGVASAIRAPAAETSLVDEDGDPVVVAGRSDEILAQLATRLRIGGVIRQKDQVHIIINDLPRKEGDVIIVDRAGAPIQIQIVRILPGRVTLRYLEAEQILRF